MRPLSYQSDKTFVAHGLVPLAVGTSASEATSASTNPPMARQARRAAEKCDTRTYTTPSLEWSPATGGHYDGLLRVSVLRMDVTTVRPPCQRPTVDLDP